MHPVVAEVVDIQQFAKMVRKDVGQLYFRGILRLVEEVEVFFFGHGYAKTITVFFIHKMEQMIVCPAESRLYDIMKLQESEVSRNGNFSLYGRFGYAFDLNFKLIYHGIVFCPAIYCFSERTVQFLSFFLTVRPLQFSVKKLKADGFLCCSSRFKQMYGCITPSTKPSFRDILVDRVWASGAYSLYKIKFSRLPAVV